MEAALVGEGFERVDYVYEPGQFAVRGSIIDVFSYASEYPFRIDLFGDEVDSIRTFEIETQLSRDKVSHMLSDKVRITTKFLEDFWIEADGAKTDVADIILRLMTHPETANERKRDEVSEDEKILLACQEWSVVHGDEPFLDPVELIDQRVVRWREILRRKFNFNKTRDGGIHSVQKHDV